MDCMRVIEHRRAVRDYTDAPVDQAVIMRLIEAAILAPSAMNQQPWAFAVSLDRRRIHEYARRSKTWLLENFSDTSLPAHARETIEDPNFSLFYNASGLVIVMATSSDAQAREDCCLAAQNLMLAARDAGLGTCWIGFARPWLNLKTVKAELRIPEHHHVVAPIIIGHPKAWPETHGRSKPKVYWLG